MQDTLKQMVDSLDMSVYPNEKFKSIDEEIKYFKDKVKEAKANPDLQFNLNMGGIKVPLKGKEALMGFTTYAAVLSLARTKHKLGNRDSFLTEKAYQSVDLNYRGAVKGYQLNAYGVYFKKSHNGQVAKHYSNGSWTTKNFKGMDMFDAMDLTPNNLK